jgi:hypothetical protein
MHRVIVDEATGRELARVRSIVEVCDSSGNVIGMFQPAEFSPRREPPPLVEEERQRLLTEPPGRKLSEVIADLERRL